MNKEIVPEVKATGKTPHVKNTQVRLVEESGLNALRPYMNPEGQALLDALLVEAKSPRLPAFAFEALIRDHLALKNLDAQKSELEARLWEILEELRKALRIENKIDRNKERVKCYQSAVTEVLNDWERSNMPAELRQLLMGSLAAWGNSEKNNQNPTVESMEENKEKDPIHETKNANRRSNPEEDETKVLTAVVSINLLKEEGMREQDACELLAKKLRDLGSPFPSSLKPSKSPRYKGWTPEAKYLANRLIDMRDARKPPQDRKEASRYLAESVPNYDAIEKKLRDLRDEYRLEKPDAKIGKAFVEEILSHLL